MSSEPIRLFCQLQIAVKPESENDTNRVQSEEQNKIDEAEPCEEQKKIDEAEPLTEEEMAEKEILLTQVGP